MKKNNEALSSSFIENNSSVAQNTKKDTKKKKNGKPNIFKRIGSKTKDIFSELKKVNWPTFPKVVKQTGIVLVVVLVFLVLITAFDNGLSLLLRLIAPRG